MTDVGGAAERLGFSGQALEWLRGLEAGDGLVVPADVDRLLDYCGVSDVDQREMVAARPEVGAEWWVLAGALAADIERHWDEPVASTGFRAWPVVPEETGAVGRFAWAWALVAALPRLKELHARRGVPDDVTRATVRVLGGVMGTHRHITGLAGVGLMPLWSPPLRLRGAEYELGRLAFGRAHLGLGDGVSGYVLMMHIPPYGALDAQAADESIDLAAKCFKQWYPEEPVTAFVCSSWLLDPQLAEYLRPESNIVRFQRRFDLLPHLPSDDPTEGDRELMRLGLQLEVPDGPLVLDQIPQDTTLQRAFVTHLRSGGHWYQRMGLLKGHGLAG